MPPWIVIVFVAAYSASAVVLLLCALVGFGQGVTARVIEALAGLICAAHAVGVPFADHLTICSLLWLGAPFGALSNVLRVRRARALHQEQLAATYAAEAQDRQTST